MTDYLKLQNGSDVRGVAMEGVVGEDVTLTPQIAADIAASFARWLKKDEKSSMKISVGRDSRLTGEAVSDGVIKGLSVEGACVFDCAMASTPAMFMSTLFEDFDCDGAIMITASHLPFNRNGLKFFTKKGGLEHDDIEVILEDCKETDISAVSANVEKRDLISVYANHLCEIIKKGINDDKNYDKPLSGFKIAVDAGNGAGGFFAGKVLDVLGANTSGSLFLEPDGSFPNHVPNPENKEAMEAISGAVTQNGCDLGIIFDTDVDRAAAVDSTGRELSRNKLIAVMSAIVAEEYPSSVIVTDSVTSSQLSVFIEEELGCIHHRFKRGYKNVINESIRLNETGKESHLAIETSGHGALKENYFLDDGAYLSAKIIIKAVRLAKEGSSLGDLLTKLGEPLEASEFRIKIKDEDFGSYGKKVLSDLIEMAESSDNFMTAPNNFEGYRATLPEFDGWFLLRMSLHDPQMPLNIESNIEGGVKKIAQVVENFLKKYDKLDLSCFL